MPSINNEANNSSSDDVLIDLSNADGGNKIGSALSLTSLNVGTNGSEVIKRVQSDNNFTSRDKSKSFSIGSIYKTDGGYSHQTDQDLMPSKDNIYRNEITSLQQEVTYHSLIYA